MDNLGIANSLLTGARPATSIRGTDAAYSGHEDTVLFRQACRSKIIGPFDGDNNNNDGTSETDQRQQPNDHQKHPTGSGLTTANEAVNAYTDVSGVRTKNINKRGESTTMYHRKPTPSKVEGSEDALYSTGHNFNLKNMKTALPRIDWDAMELHALEAKEEEKRRRNDREEIRKRLAMGIESDDVGEFGKYAKKPSLHSRLQSGKNLQLCFVNETASDGSDTENHKNQTEALSQEQFKAPRDVRKARDNKFLTKNSFASLPPSATLMDHPSKSQDDSQIEMDFFTQQAKLQTEARIALAQAKELARIQMQVERQQRKHTRMSDLVRQSLNKLGIPFPWDCRRLHRQILTELNVDQLQVIVNDLHTQIEGLNEELVQLLLKRDDFHMEQDSMLVDIEDLTRYLTAKQIGIETCWNASGPVSLPLESESVPAFPPKQRFHNPLVRIAGRRN